MERILIKDAYENNLKHLDVEIPLNKFTCVTGCSGCGKSSLVFDTLYAESQRGFLEGMTGNIYSQKLMNKPKVMSIENLRPALNISQNYYNVNPRSTIGTITEISYYLRTLFSLINSNTDIIVPENTFSSNNPKSFCPNCNGTGIEMVVSSDLLIPDHNKTLREGAILYYKGAPESKEQKCLEAICEHYDIDIDKKYSKLTKREIDILLYTEEVLRVKVSYKEGKRRKQHIVSLQGVIPLLKNQIKNSSSITQATPYSKYTATTVCHVCNGARLGKNALTYTLGGMNYNELESLEVESLLSWIKELKDERITAGNKELVKQLKDSIIQRLESLIKLNVGYLCLNRSVPSLSGGERQRVRIATQLTCSLKGLIYILDEPCKGLHHRDIVRIIDATKNLIKKGNTVIAIEHNKQYISESDYKIELGPVGGTKGGYLISAGETKDKDSLKLVFKTPIEANDYFGIKNVVFRNIYQQDAVFPIGGITCITGVSGSGKTSLAIATAESLNKNTAKKYGDIYGAESIKRIITVNQSPIGKTPRSTVVSYLEIFDEIRTLFAKTDAAQKLKLSPSMFSMNVKGGRCECCQGTGLQKIELNYLPSTYIICPECEGKRYNEKILSVSYKGKTILDVLETPVSEIIEMFADTKKVYSVLDSMIELGLGYLTLGQMSMNLSGGEAQRIKLAKALGAVSGGRSLYILDEPTSGLNDTDIKKFIKVLFSLQGKGETILIIEHNLEFIAKVSDYIIDFGLKGGSLGGKIVAQGKPREVFENNESSLYKLDVLSE
ncbi:ATP-binding cassette domain-containing protein [Lachnospiraceae bacterium C1.1]|nr:ATP-binding cassette domain-containing protein [Lachnospiraceae bacterium C1.1]